MNPKNVAEIRKKPKVSTRGLQQKRNSTNDR